MAGWKDTLRKLSETEQDVHRAVSKVLKTMTKDEMVAACHDLMVIHASTTFVQVWGPNGKKTTTISMHPLPNSARVFSPPPEIKQRAWLVNGELVHWATATAEQHLTRAAMRRKIAVTEIQVAELHEKAAEEIQAAGVRCLADLASVQVAA